ncbi:MAG: metal ABC transporter substrate-binding protein [Bacillota bacterium]|nr:metal ABC transporter substrate-binding protein [Bacillota bacterium]
MKKSISFLLSICLTLAFTGCSTGNQMNGAGKTEIKVYASIYPVYDFAKKIGGDRINLKCIVPSGTEPHDWEPASTDIANLEKADVFLYNGAGMEQWAEKVTKSIKNKNIVISEVSKGIELLTEKSEGKAETQSDPHVWLNPQNAKIEMENIKNALEKADPQNQDFYEQNYSDCSRQLDELDKEFKDTLSTLPGKDVIVAHQAFGYLCSAYGLNQVAIEGLTADSEPDPAKMAEIIDYVKKNNIKVIYYEDLINPKVAKSIADATGANTMALNPVEGLTDDQQASGLEYFSVMRSNLSALSQGLR